MNAETWQSAEGAFLLAGAVAVIAVALFVLSEWASRTWRIRWAKRR